MKYTVNLLDAGIDPIGWAQQRDAEGWDALSVADHIFTGRRAYPHVWVTATALAMATHRPTISTAFTNNLFRSPVEVAQAALQLQRISGGRFELGLGAGWADDEVTGSGLAYPEPRDRAGMFAEAAQIVRALLHEGACSFHGEYYDIEVPTIGPSLGSEGLAPPPLVGSVGGPRTTREVTPHLDRVEIKPMSAATRSGALDLSVMATVDDDHLLAMIERVRDVDPTIEISMFTLFSVGDDEMTSGLRAAMAAGGGMFRRFFGSPSHVADGLAWLDSIGIHHASLSPMTDHALEALAPAVLSR